MFQRMTNTFDPRLSVLSQYLATVKQAAGSEFDKITQYRDYYNGDQAEALTDVQKALLGKDIDFTLNICATIVNIICDRLKVRSIDFDTTPEDSEGNEKIKAESEKLTNAFRKVWDYNRMDELTREIHAGVARDGESFAVIEYDRDAATVKITINDAYDGTTGMYAVYDEDGRTLKYFVKKWKVKPAPTARNQRSINRMNIYYDNRVEKYKDNQGGEQWTPADPLNVTRIETPDGYYTTTVVWLTENGQPTGKPLGFQVFHFRGNTARGAGRSDLADVVPGVQDTINTANGMKFAAEQLQGTPLLLLFTNADIAELKLFPGSPVKIPSSDGAESNAMQVQAANLTQLRESLYSQIRLAFMIANVPAPQLTTTAQVQAEGTQQQNEVLFLSKIERRQVSLGNQYEDMARMAIKLLTLYKKDFNLIPIQQIQDLNINCIWESAIIRNEVNDATRAVEFYTKMDVPFEDAAEVAGFSADKIAEMVEKQDTKRMQGIMDQLLTQQTNPLTMLQQAQQTPQDMMAQQNMEMMNNARQPEPADNGNGRASPTQPAARGRPPNG